jgi:MacB-like periplasmic core domain
LSTARHPDYKQHNPGLPNGNAAIPALLDTLPPDFFYEPGMVIAEGEYVMLHGRYVRWGTEIHGRSRYLPVAVLSYGYWTRRFSRDPDVIGKMLYVNGVPITVIGVAAHFYGVESGGRTTDLWVPLQNRPELNAWGTPAMEHTLYGIPNWWSLMLIARLRPGVTQSQALAHMNPLFAHTAWETVGKEVKRTGEPMGLQMVSARGLGLSAEDFRQPLHVLMGMVALVLVMCEPT